MNYTKELTHLKLIRGIGDVTIRKIITRIDDLKELAEMNPKELAEKSEIGLKAAQTIVEGLVDPFVIKRLDDLFRLMQSKNIKNITIYDKQYPQILREISQPPVMLFAIGDLALLEEEMLAVVGTRKPSHYGIYATKKIVGDLVEYGFTIVSGLAKGIDSLAHSVTLENAGKTIAVLGCGVDVVYPQEHRNLYNSIAKNGLVISEYLPGERARHGYFPLRNRIISGLSYGTLVVEASLKSGTLITAQASLEQSREVFAIPGPISSINSVGTNHLIKQGAKLVQTVDDIIEEFTYLDLKNTVKEKQIVKLTGNEQRIYNVLLIENADIDRLLQQTELNFNEIYQYLLTMQLKGLIVKLPGGQYMLNR